MTDTPPKEPLNPAAEADANPGKPAPSADNSRRWVKLGVGAAIGSAAIAAALLYANRPQRKDRP